MSRVRNRQKSAAKKPSKPDPKKEEIKQDDEKPFDFGGLPNRDLKKNLGCG